MGPANSAKPVSQEDYDLIFEELKAVQTEPNFKKEKEKTDDPRRISRVTRYFI